MVHVARNVNVYLAVPGHFTAAEETMKMLRTATRVLIRCAIFTRLDCALRGDDFEY